MDPEKKFPGARSNRSAQAGLGGGGTTACGEVPGSTTIRGPLGAFCGPFFDGCACSGVIDSPP